MALLVDRADLTAQQRKGLEWFAAHPPDGQTYADDRAYCTALLAELGGKGFAAKQAAKRARRVELDEAAGPNVTKATIDAQLAAEGFNG